MATAKEFVDRVARIDGVSGCLLMRNDGVLIGQTINDSEVYSTLLMISGRQAHDVMEKVGFSYCRHLGFSRRDNCHFYVFPILDNYLLGVIQHSDCSAGDMLDTVYRLIGRVSTNRADVISMGDEYAQNEKIP